MGATPYLHIKMHRVRFQGIKSLLTQGLFVKQAIKHYQNCEQGFSVGAGHLIHPSYPNKLL